MSGAALEQAFRAAGGRIVAALAARFRDLDLAEISFAEACARAVEAWVAETPRDPAGWLYRAAERAALDELRRRRTRELHIPDPAPPEPTPEEKLMNDAGMIPDERMRLIFVCCHPAIAPDARAALTLRLVCGLTTTEIARAFLLPESTVAQRLVRAKRKIAQAGVSFEVPGPDAWPERLGAVLSTLEVAYAQAHADAAGVSLHAGYATEMLTLTALLASMLPDEPEVAAMAALVRYAEARRPARLDEAGAMVPLAEQDPVSWRRPLIGEADRHLARANVGELDRAPARVLQAALHGAWCARRSLSDPPPWPRVLALYDALLARRDDGIVRLNRAVALAEVAGPQVALDEVEALPPNRYADFAPYHALRADLLGRLGRGADAVTAYGRAIVLAPGPAEQLWLQRQCRTVAGRLRH